MRYSEFTNLLPKQLTGKWKIQADQDSTWTENGPQYITIDELKWWNTFPGASTPSAFTYIDAGETKTFPVSGDFEYTKLD